MAFRTASLAFVSFVVIACNSKQAELAPEPKPETTATASATASASASAGMTAPSAPTSTTSTGGDPLKGKFTLADATTDLKGNGAIIAKIDTSKGAIQCKLLSDKAPNTVANFIGLATGKRTWRNPVTGTWGNKPAYDGTVFHRIIKGFMIQGGDPKGDGSGEPGYVIPDELWEGSKHDHAGQLCMANRGHDTNGAQFFITDDAAKHLDGNYTIFGECAPVQVVHDIASVPLQGENPITPVKINKVTISRDADKKK